MNNNFIACVQSFCYQQCTHNLKRSLHWSIAALITFCSKSNQVCIRQFFRAINVTNLCFVHALLHNPPNFIICRSISIKLYDTFDAIFCGSNITLLVFGLSQTSVATLIRWGGWNSHTHMCHSFLNLTVETALKSVNIWWTTTTTYLDFNEARHDSVISWTICKPSVSRSRNITTPAPYHSIFYRQDALPDAQPIVSKHWRQN